MKKITIREIIKATGAQMIALGDMEEALNKEIWYVTQDSRETKEGVLFVARVGRLCFWFLIRGRHCLIWRLITEICLIFPLLR